MSKAMLEDAERILKDILPMTGEDVFERQRAVLSTWLQTLYDRGHIDERKEILDVIHAAANAACGPEIDTENEVAGAANRALWEVFDTISDRVQK